MFGVLVNDLVPVELPGTVRLPTEDSCMVDRIDSGVVLGVLPDV